MGIGGEAKERDGGRRQQQAAAVKIEKAPHGAAQARAEREADDRQRQRRVADSQWPWHRQRQWWTAGLLLLVVG